MFDASFVALALVVVLANLVQTAIGFGSMLICVTLAASFWPVLELPPLLIPLSLTQTSLIVLRHRAAVDRRLLFRRVLPVMGLGMAGGLAIAGTAEAPWVRPALGAMVLVLACRELWRSRSAAPPSWGVSMGALLGAGVVHGVYATGGPLLVWALGREDLDRHTFRATLTAVWQVLAAVLIAVFVARGQIDGASATRSALLLVPMGLGIVLGERLHDRIEEDRFRTAVWVLLALASIPLLVS